MDPNEVDPDPRNHSYEIGDGDTTGSNEVTYDGVTGRIATTGEPVRVSGYHSIAKIEGHVGKWDNYVWQGRPAELFRCMLGVAIRDKSGEIIGVIKVENKLAGDYIEEDVKLLTQIGTSLSGSLEELINEKRELSPAIIEYEYKVPRSQPDVFEKEKTGYEKSSWVSCRLLQNKAPEPDDQGARTPRCVVL